MKGKRLIQKLKLQNFLSYEREEIELQPLNVLIGPNGSGKSNLIEAFSILKATPTNLLVPIRKGNAIKLSWPVGWIRRIHRNININQVDTLQA